MIPEAASSRSSYPPLAAPRWAASSAFAETAADAAFMAGGALYPLDQIVRTEPEWIGVWRQRLALKCAATAVRLAGRIEDERALRDAWLLRRPGDDPGPSGQILSAWKRLASRPAALDTETLQSIAGLLGIRWDEALTSLADAFDDLRLGGRAAPFAAADIIAKAFSIHPEAEMLGWWLADMLVADKLRWSVPVPLMMGQRFSAVFRGAGGRGRIRPGEEGFERAICLALAQAATEASRLAAEIARRAERLAAVTPKLRSKGAGDVIRLLLSEDAIAGTVQTARLSRFASRRLFERLQQLDAVRELSGRPTFRIYGL
ncbi:DUF1403 family protein [Neorhizobium sp. DT-125]|uniref:DUF1403 family protein n=1 Tax=Neorhizobium sp. DT-125 TaxID=3396163 RepID=UPI003F19BDC9